MASTDDLAADLGVDEGDVVILVRQAGADRPGAQENENRSRQVNQLATAADFWRVKQLPSQCGTA